MELPLVPLKGGGDRSAIRVEEFYRITFRMKVRFSLVLTKIAGVRPMRSDSLYAKPKLHDLTARIF
jgi:hypothetical protein